jgi:hypothetical protein
MSDVCVCAAPDGMNGPHEGPGSAMWGPVQYQLKACAMWNQDPVRNYTISIAFFDLT